MAFSPPDETFVPFAESFDGRSRPSDRRPGWSSLASLGRPYHNDPHQPRVPAGHPDGGRWTRAGNGPAPDRSAERRDWTRVASNEPPDLPDKGGKRLPPARRGVPERLRWRGGRGGFLGTIGELVFRKMMEDYRKRWAERDLLGYIKGLKEGVVAISRLDGTPIIGTNSTFASGTYSDADDRAAKQLRAAIIKNNPDEFEGNRNVGQAPLDAVFHAETTVLLRAARANGGTLAGKTLEVLVERKPCFTSCEQILPLVCIELGNPTVIFKSLDGWIGIVRDGEWEFRGK